jgi:hypothetical protein
MVRRGQIAGAALRPVFEQEGIVVTAPTHQEVDICHWPELTACCAAKILWETRLRMALPDHIGD